MKLNILKYKYTYLAFAVLVLVLFLTQAYFGSGVKHESAKIKLIAVHVFIMVFCLFLIGDFCKFIAVSMDAAFFPAKEKKLAQADENPIIHTRTDYLKMRLSSLKSQLYATEEHLNESLNLRYQLLSVDILLYATYYILLLCLVLVAQNELLYHNTNMMTTVFDRNQTYSLGLSTVRNFEQLYLFIESALIDAFNPNTDEAAHQSWVYGEQTNKVGVVRLRQLRWIEDFHLGWDKPKYSSLDYMRGWERPYKRQAYTDKYWHIYEPWLPSSTTYSFFDKIFLNINHYGYYQNYPELKGYITLLARTRGNSMKIVDYLRKHHWINRQTAVVFMDFALYNADADIITLCNLIVEQTPFGTVMPKVNIASIKLEVADRLGTLGFVIAILYSFVLIRFSKTLVTTLWYEPSMLRSMWNKIDLLILVLNVVLIVLLITQEIVVANLLEKVEYASKLEFLDFRKPARLQAMTSGVMGFLVCVTTLRLWKVFQFGSVFQLFSSALYTAWQALASTALIILIFLIGFGFAVDIINGNNSQSFNYLTRSIISALCFSFGFNLNITPQDLFYGGKLIGLIFYVILAFVISQLLINLFITTINGYFTHAKAIRDARSKRYINFLQFLRIEYSYIFKLFHKLPCFDRSYHRNNRTVAENIKIALAQKQRKGVKSRHRVFATGSTKELDESQKHDEYKRRIARLFTTASILQTQMLLLEHLCFPVEEETTSTESIVEDEEESSDDQ